METYSLQFEIDASSAVAGSKQFQSALSNAAVAAEAFDRKASAAFNNLKTSSTGGFSQLIQNMNRLSSVKFNTSNLNSFSQAIQNIKPSATASKIPATFNSIGSAANSMGNHVSKAATHMRGLENAFSGSYQAGSVFRNLIGSITIGELGKQIFEVGNSFATFKAAISSAAGSTAEANKELEYIVNTADSLGAPLRQAVQEYGKFAASTRAAGVSAEATHSVFEGLSIAGTVLGLSAEKMGRNFDTATQIFSKGKLSMEELRQQFGDSLPGAFQKMENALKSRGIIQAGENLSTLLAQGKISSKALLLFSADLIRDYGSQLPEAMKRPGAQLIILGNQITKLFETVNTSGFGAALSKQFQAINRLVSSNAASDAARKVGAAVGNIINFVGEGIQFLIRNADTVATVMKVVIGYFTLKTSFGLFASMGAEIKSIISPLTFLIGLIRSLSGAVSISAIFAGLASVGPMVVGIGTSFIAMKNAIIGSTIAARLYGAYMYSMSAIGTIVMGIQRAFVSMRLAIALTSGAALAARTSIVAMAGTAGLVTSLQKGFIFLSATIRGMAASFSLAGIANGIWNGIVSAGTALNALFSASSVVASAGTAAVGAAAAVASGPVGLLSAAISAATIAAGLFAVAVGGLFLALGAGYAASADYGGMFDFITSDKYTMLEKFQAGWTVLKQKIIEASEPVIAFGKYILTMFGAPTENLKTFGETFVTLFQHIGLKAAQSLDFLMEQLNKVLSAYDAVSYAADPKNASKTVKYAARTVGLEIASGFLSKDAYDKASQGIQEDYRPGSDAPYKSTFASDYSKATGYRDPKMQGPSLPKSGDSNFVGPTQKSFSGLVVIEAEKNLEKQKQIDKAEQALSDAKIKRQQDLLEIDAQIAEKEAANGVRLAGNKAKKDASLSEFKSLVAAVDPARAASDKYRESLTALDEAVTRGDVTRKQYLEYFKKLGKEYDDVRTKQSLLTKDMQSLMGTLDPLAKRQKEYAESLKTLSENKAALGDERYLELAQKLKTLYPDLITGTSTLSSEMVSLRESLDPAVKSQNDFDNAVRTLDMNKQALGLEEYNRLLKITKERFAGAAEGANQFKDGVAVYFDSIGTFADRFSKVQEDFTSGFVDNFSNMISGAKADWAGLIDSMIKGLIKLMVQQAFKKLFGLVEGKDTGEGFFGNAQRKENYMDNSQRPSYDFSVQKTALDKTAESMSELNSRYAAQIGYMEGNVKTAGENKNDPKLDELKTKRKQIVYDDQRANNPQKYDTSYLFNNKQPSVAQQTQSDLARNPNGFKAVAPRLMGDLQKDYNLKKEDAAAIVGNLGHESNGFRSMQEKNPTVKGSRGGLGYAQWTGPRRRQFEAYSAEKGLKTNSYEANYGFLKKELSGEYSGALNSVRRPGTLEQKTRRFEGQYERAGIKHYESRYQYANKALNSGSDKTKIAAINAEHIATMKKTNIKIATNMQNDFREPTRKIGANFSDSLNGGSSAINQISNSTRNLNTHASSTKPKVDSLGNSINNLHPPIQKAKSSMASMGGQANGLGDILGNVLGQVTSGLGGGGGGGDVFGSVMSGLGGLFGFAEGGSMTVGGSGGADTKLAAFKVTPGERVDVKTPSQMRAEERARSSRGYLESGSKENLTQGGNGVKIVNVMDPTLAVAAMSSGNGKKAIINAIKANPRAVRQVLRA